MRLKLCYQRDGLLNTLANRGFRLEEIRIMLEQLAAAGVQLELVETSAMSQELLVQSYLEAAMPAVSRKYRVRQIFGSKRRPGCLFGKEVPALVVYMGEDGHPADVYPHEDRGRMVTIRDFLERLLQSKATRGEAVQAAARMDKRRARLGSIGFSASELIREGRLR